MITTNAGFVIGIALILPVLFFIVRMIAIKTGKDPIMRKYKPGTPVYESYQRLRNPRRFAATLTISILVLLLLSTYVVIKAHRLAEANTPSSHYVLIFGLISAITIFVVSLVVGYNMLIKK